LKCVEDTQKPISNIILYKFTEPEPQLPNKLAEFWKLTNCFLLGRSRDGLRLAAVFCYISHHLYHTDIEKSDLQTLTSIIYAERWELEPLVIPWRKYKAACRLIAHQVIDVQMYAEHLSTWSYLFERDCIESVRAQLHRQLNKKMKQRLLIDALKSEVSIKRVRKMVLEWGLDIRGFDIFPVIKKVGNGKWNMKTIVSLAPHVAQLVALGSTCAIFHPCSPLIIRACRAGIITNLLWRYQKSSKLYLSKDVILNILQFVSSPNTDDIRKTWYAGKMREGENMMKNVIKMLGHSSEIIYKSGVDCTPNPGGDVSLAQNLENRNEYADYGLNSEFIPSEEKDANSTLNSALLRDDSRGKRKWKKPLASSSDGAESKISKRNIEQNRDRYFGHHKPCLMEHVYDKENVNTLIRSGYQETNISKKRACNDNYSQWNAVRCKPKKVPSFSLQERNVSQKYNQSTLPTRTDLQIDIELKMKWTQKKSSSLTDSTLPISISNGKSWRPPTLKPNMEKLNAWTLEKFQRLQERISEREKMKGLFVKSSKDRLYHGKRKHRTLGHEKQLHRLPEQSSLETNLFKEKPFAEWQISEKICKGGNEGKKRVRYLALSSNTKRFL